MIEQVDEYLYLSDSDEDEDNIIPTVVMEIIIRKNKGSNLAHMLRSVEDEEDYSIDYSSSSDDDYGFESFNFQCFSADEVVSEVFSTTVD